MTIYLKEYQTFESVTEMDGHIRSHLTEHYYKLNDTDRTVLSFLAQYACKYPGAAHLKVKTVTQVINKSDSTVRRSLRKLENLRIIERISTIRRVAKGYGANILVILPYVDQSEMISREVSQTLLISSTEEHFTEKETDYSLSPKKNYYIIRILKILRIILYIKTQIHSTNSLNQLFSRCLEKTKGQ